MNKDYKLMGGLIPVILILCIGLYGIPVLGSQTDSNQVTSVAYNGSNSTTNNTVASEQSDTNNDSYQTDSSNRVNNVRSTTSRSIYSTTNTGDNTQNPSLPQPDDNAQPPSNNNGTP